MMRRIWYDIIMSVCTAYGSFQGLFPLGPQKTLLVPTKDPGLSAHGRVIQESILGSCHLPDYQRSVSAYNVLRRCQMRDIQTSPVLT